MLRGLIALLMTSMAVAGPSWAASWPERPVRFIVPFPAGGGVDTVARVYGAALAGLIGQEIIIDNRSGASGAIGAQAVAKAAPDGYTFLMSSPAEVMVNAIAGQPMSYDPRKDLVPVALAGETPLAIVAHPSVGARNLKDLIARAKAGQLTLSYGTPGRGSTMNFAGEALKSETGLDWQHVPYKGAAPAVNDVLGGQIQIVISGMPPLVQHIKAGKLTALAVTSSKRSPVLPDVMAVSELQGLSDFRFTNWMGVFAPQGTPQEIVDRMGQAFETAARDPDVMKRLQDAGLVPSGIRGPAFAKFLDEERARYQDVAGKTAIKSD
ncbi:tripartite tricarboxylate transporter substrate binding protein [Bordetella sp. BOR01]|uniref:Bug family tripartite tricarboxylate transporter substrate binding protein n=1 Tax=Bordetella sp. BOR01 TaxID=2854779 RepID=UPI001C46A5BE|nr:tripartite tricarboxylate transporter substrate binding protein [Bordetella sp. BOR01]MBV7483786.1 tripartite tricarboxylate transporter substrate binding protein [Bordetella sp. BOR01]